MNSSAGWPTHGSRLGVYGGSSASVEFMHLLPAHSSSFRCLQTDVGENTSMNARVLRERGFAPTWGCHPASLENRGEIVSLQRSLGVADFREPGQRGEEVHEFDEG